MKDRDAWKPLYKYCSAIIILIIEGVIYWVAWKYYYNSVIAFPFWRKGIWLMVALYILTLLLFLKLYSGLKIGYLKRGNIIYSHLLSLLFANIVTYFQIALIDRGFRNVKPLLLMTLIEAIFIVIWTYMFHFIYCKLFPPRRMILVYGKRSDFHLLEKINAREDKYQICEMININKGTEEVKTRIKQYDGVIIGDLSAEIRNDILKYCYRESVRSYSIPKISDIIMRNSDILSLFDTPLFLNRNQAFTIERKIWKRLMDLILVGIVLFTLWPVILVIMIGIKFYDGGPVFYKQNRLTLGGQVFKIYKFRSMIVDAEKDGIARLASEKDCRITPIGHLLRRTRFDELPQIFNILKGEMSVVGPRPERPEIAEEYEKDIPEFRYRLKVKAGLTGYAQVYGKYNTSPYDKLKLDMMYIEKQSFLLDLKLVFMTPKILFMKESTEGISEGANDKKY